MKLLFGEVGDLPEQSDADIFADDGGRLKEFFISRYIVVAEVRCSCASSRLPVRR